MCCADLSWACCRASDSPESSLKAIQPTADGILLRVKAVPRASRTELAGYHGDFIRVRVSATPADGAANRELLRFLADLLSVPRSAVHLTAGASGRLKLIAVSGATAEQVYACLVGP